MNERLMNKTFHIMCIMVQSRLRFLGGDDVCTGICDGVLLEDFVG